MKKHETARGEQRCTRVQLFSKAAEKKAEPRAEMSQTARMRQVPYAYSRGMASASHTSRLDSTCWKPVCTNTAISK